MRRQRRRYFFPASIASPFLHAMILIFGALTISLDSILKDASLTMNVHTSSHSRYVCRWPCARAGRAVDGQGTEETQEGLEKETGERRAGEAGRTVP